MAINRSDVLTSAIGVLDRSGLPDLTMRRVAAECMARTPEATYRAGIAALAGFDELDVAAGEDGHLGVGQRRDAQLARDDHDGDPDRQRARDIERDQRRDHQRFIRNGIGQFAKISNQSAGAGNIAIELICEH